MNPVATPAAPHAPHTSHLEPGEGQPGTVREHHDHHELGFFRKWIFSVKRSVDIPIDETRENPIAAYHPLKLALAEIRRLESMGFALP